MPRNPESAAAPGGSTAAVQATNAAAAASKLIERLELFDEFEEWYMMQEHYCVAYGINDAQGWLGDFRFSNHVNAHGQS